MRHICFLFFLTTSPFLSFGNSENDDACASTNNQKFQIKNIEIIVNPIFDEEASNAIKLHAIANSIHVITKPSVIKERLAFDQGDFISISDITEAEAILREQLFLANADISYRVDCRQKEISLTVKTYDNWSLVPTLSYSRSGGNNSTIIGVRENNLFGLGVRGAFRYSEDEQRTGYRVLFSSATPWLRHSILSVGLEDNDDGDVYSISFRKPFYHLGSSYGLDTSILLNERVEDIFQNDQTRNSILIDSESISASYGWKLTSDEIKTTRFILGINRVKSIFDIDLDSPNNNPVFLAQDRDFVYPWVGFEYIERNIIVLQDINLINHPEDINLGLEFNVRFGIEVNNSLSDFGTHTSLAVKKGFALGPSLILVDANVNAIQNTDIDNFRQLDMQAQYFYRATDLIGYYARISSTFSSGQFLDNPIVLDDDNGVRGFPTQYQHGNNRVSASAEVRLYTNWDFYQLFNTGFAVFVDIGKAYGGQFADLNIDKSALSSFGIGARLYSNKASRPGLVHIDFSRPNGNQDSINSWELSAQFRRNF